jgi:hypothetical protein
MPGKFFGALVKGGRLLFNRMKEKPEVKVDEYALEHMLFYHGLVGSSAENQRDFREVRADIVEAISHRSSVQLAITLRLPPLWWEDKLISILAELPEESRASVTSLLMPDDPTGTLAANANPIKHDDWRVRANAAVILSYLHADQSATILGGVLGDSTAGGKLASCYVAYALGKLRSEAARLELVKYKDAEEPWLRVDIAGSLALSQFSDVAKILAGMLSNEIDMRDYMSVAISKQHRPHLFVRQPDPTLKAGGWLLILGILDATQHTFTDTLVFDTGVHELLTDAVDQAVKERTILPVSAALQLLYWARRYRANTKVDLAETFFLETAQLPSDLALATMLEQLKSDEVKATVARQLEALLKEQVPNAELFFAIQLAGMLALTDLEKVLLPYLTKDFLLRDTVVEAIGAMHGDKGAESLMEFARSLQDVDHRNSMEKSKQPVAEDDVAASKTYWCILKAMGGIATASSAKFLLAATDDFAPDKRAQALEALTDVLSVQPAITLTRQIDEVLKVALLDSAPMMQLAAVAGVARLNRVHLINEVAQLIDANENAVSKDVFIALRRLSEQGNAAAVDGVLAERLRTTKDAYKRTRIEQFLATKIKS